LALEPNSEKALFFAAIAAQRRGERDLAVERYRRMLAQEPPPNIRAIIDAQIRALGAEPAAGPAAAGPVAAVPEVLVSVSIAPALAEAVRADQDASDGAVVFVFIRRPGESGPPLAAKRIAARLPFEVRLNESDAMLPGVTLQVGETVEVSARVARDGNATPRSGDPVGKMLYTIGRDAGKKLSIDGRTP
jgi:cytochrome c-type biogenesis protein CcmH